MYNVYFNITCTNNIASRHFLFYKIRRLEPMILLKSVRRRRRRRCGMKQIDSDSARKEDTPLPLPSWLQPRRDAAEKEYIVYSV